MPWTQLHPFYGWFIVRLWFSGNLHSSAVYWTILFGSVFPDLPRHLFLLYRIFICDEAYFTNFGCNGQFIYFAENWVHSFPLSMVGTIVSYFIYCRISHKTLAQTFYPCSPIKRCHSNSSIPIPIMHPTATLLRIDEEEKHKLTNEESILLKPAASNVDILSVKTYSTIPSLTHNKLIGRRANSFEYKFGHWLTCKNCWCDAPSLWRMLTYFFLSVLIHSLIDFPLHHSNAHQQFLPFSTLVWKSPLSYYEYKYYGYIVGPILCGIAMVLSIWIFIHKKNDWKIYHLSYYYFWMVLFVANDIWCCYIIVECIMFGYKKEE